MRCARRWGLFFQYATNTRGCIFEGKYENVRSHACPPRRRDFDSAPRYRPRGFVDPRRIFPAPRYTFPTTRARSKWARNARGAKRLRGGEWRTGRVRSNGTVKRTNRVLSAPIDAVGAKLLWEIHLAECNRVCRHVIMFTCLNIHIYVCAELRA